VIGLAGFFTGINPKVYFYVVFIGFIASSGFFGWQYISNLNEEKLELSRQIKDEQAAKELVTEQLNYKAAESDHRRKAAEVYSGIIADTMSELTRLESEKSKLKSRANELEFKEHFKIWAEKDLAGFNDCMQLSFNKLLNNLSEATANRLPKHKNPMSCTASTKPDNSPEN
jgi:hypothetical protein